MKTKTVKIKNYPNTLTCAAEVLAADCKFRGMNKFRAWGEFVKMRGLCPEMGAKEFYKLFERVKPASMVQEVEVPFTPTHLDTLLGRECQISRDARGVYRIIWDFGMTGGYPPDFPIEERFSEIPLPKPLTKDEKRV